MQFFLLVNVACCLVATISAKLSAPASTGSSGDNDVAATTTQEQKQRKQQISFFLPEDIPLVEVPLEEIPTEEEIPVEALILPNIDYVGNDGNFAVFPLQECMGDCDTDDDCAGSLECFSRSAGQAMPGCLGGEDDVSESDYCYSAETMAPTNLPTQFPTSMPTPYPIIQVLVSNTTDPATTPLAGCQGVCKGDNDCSDGLMCYRRNLGEEVPYCKFQDENMRQSSLFLDFCTLPPTPSPTLNPTTLQPSPSPTRFPTNAPTTAAPTPWPTPSVPQTTFVNFLGNPPPQMLQRCQGDCDSDNDCDGNLICYQRDPGGEAPGCMFTAQQGATLNDDTDVCIDRRSLGNQVRLRMYWREGYRWQEESREHIWCMAHSQSGTCHYGTDSRSCSSDEIYTDWCSGSDRQIFQIMYQPSGQMMIKAVTRNQCLEGNRPKLRTCDPNNSNQLWHPMNGGYDSTSFEITRKGEESKCLTQHHHPKEGEVIELNDCERERRYTTNAWQFYW